MKGCDYYSVFFKETPSIQKEISYTSTDIKKSESYYTINNGKKANEGEWKTWYPNSQLKSIEHYENDKREGKLTTYWENGTLKREDVFQNDSLVSGKCYNDSGVETAYYPYFVKPQFPGGEEEMFKYLKRKIHYPQSYDRIEGVVMSRFIITEKGEVVNVEVLNKSYENMQREVIRVLKRMPKWEPGKIDGIPVSAYYKLPVTFSVVPLK